MPSPDKIKSRDRDAILQSLRAGVVPRKGLQHIQVGRSQEVQALIKDIDRIADKGTAIRIIVGEFGSGKTFFLHLIRSVALEKGLVTVHADLNLDRRFHSTSGHARSLFTELTYNLSTRTKWDGQGLGSVVERFIGSALQQARQAGLSAEEIIQKRLDHLCEMVNGYDFANVIAAYWRGHEQGNDRLKNDAVRWLRGEYSTRTDARHDLGVRTIIDDANIYDQLKLLARFVCLAGYKGLLVLVDELVNLYKLANTRARNSNYEQILRILNDTLQSAAESIGFLLCATPESVSDSRRGLYSYPALQSRLQENTFASAAGVVDYSGPVIRLANLSPEDIYVLLHKLRHVQAGGDEKAHLVPDEALRAFLEHCSQKIGDAYFRTPRNTVRAFLDMLAVLEQHPHIDWRELVGQTQVQTEESMDIEESSDEDSEDTLASFKL
jgi:hypothetical protein